MVVGAVAFDCRAFDRAVPAFDLPPSEKPSPGCRDPPNAVSQGASAGRSPSCASATAAPASGGPNGSVPKPLHFRHAAVARDRRPPEADVAKATFCKHFPAKADLIVASIAAAEAAGRKALPALDQPEPLTAGAEALIALARWPDSLGCRFQFPVAEHAAATNAVHAAAVAVKRRVLAAMEAPAAAQGLKRPKPVAEAVFLFIEGVWAFAPQVRGQCAAGQRGPCCESLDRGNRGAEMTFQAYLDSIQAKTGLAPADVLRLARDKAFASDAGLAPGVKATQITDGLKADYGLGHGHAMAIVALIKGKAD